MKKCSEVEPTEQSQLRNRRDGIENLELAKEYNPCLVSRRWSTGSGELSRAQMVAAGG